MRPPCCTLAAEVAIGDLVSGRGARQIGPMQLRTIALALGLVFAAAGCRQAGSPSEVAQAHEIAWREGDVDDALAEAREPG